MTKVTLGNLDPRAIQELRGVVVFRDTKHGVVAQKWPTKSKKPRSRLQKLYQARFGIAAQMAANPEPMQLMTAIEMAKGTEQVPRDILTMAALGQYYEIVNPDGTVWPHVDGPIVGSDRPEGDDMWQWSHWDSAYAGTNSTSLFASKGVIVQPHVDLHVRKLRALLTTVSGGIYTASIARLNSSNVVQEVTESPPIIAPFSMQWVLTFKLETLMPSPERHALMVTRKNAGNTYALPMPFQTGSKWLIPIAAVAACTLAKTAVQVGDTLTSTSTQLAPFGLLIPNED